MLNIEQKNDIKILRESGQTLQAIGNKYGISRERVRQLVGYIKRPTNNYPIGFKRCYMCKTTLPYSDFYESSSKQYSDHHKCKKCLKISSAKWGKIYQYKYIKGGIYYLKTKARNAVFSAIAKHKIIKPNKCEIDNECYGRLEAHHYLGYEKEHYLDVRWLCSKHHQLADKNLI